MPELGQGCVGHQLAGVPGDLNSELPRPTHLPQITSPSPSIDYVIDRNSRAAYT